MNKLVLGTVAVHDFMTHHPHVLSAQQHASYFFPDAFVAGVCAVVIFAILRAAMVVHVAAFQSVVPLLRTLVLIVLALVLLSAIALTETQGDAPTPPPADPPALVHAT